MLDKEICNRFGVKPFMQWLMKELDELEDVMHSANQGDLAYVTTASRYYALKAARDAYARLEIK